MIKQIQKIPSHQKLFQVPDVVSEMNTALCQLSAHFDNCLNAITHMEAKETLRSNLPRMRGSARRLFDPVKS